MTDEELGLPVWALTLTQPWATLVAIHAKTIETRSWGTKVTGPIAIHAAKGFTEDDRYICSTEPFREVLAAAGYENATKLPFASIVCVSNLAACYRFNADTLAIITRGALKGAFPRYEHHFGNYDADRFGLKLENTIPLETPVPARGMQKLWRIPADVRDVLRAQLTALAA